MTVGVNHDTLPTAGWLDLSKGPLVLHVPDMDDRYYSVQFTDPSKNTNFAYVGKRTTGTQAGDYLITGPGWKGQVPSGMKQISSPNNSVLAPRTGTRGKRQRPVDRLWSFETDTANATKRLATQPVAHKY